MTQDSKLSWLRKGPMRTAFARRIREAVLKNSWRFGGSVAGAAINFGYLVKCSQTFRTADVHTDVSRCEFYDRICDAEKLAESAITYIEFGVYRGKSFGYWLSKNVNRDALFYGFDTFSGLPEDWGHISKGSFNPDGVVPKYEDSRYYFYKGLFADTVPPFLAEAKGLEERRLVINLDADLYSSTLYSLLQLGPFIKRNDVLLFDEFFSVVNSATEYRAFLDFMSIADVNLKCIAKTTTHCAFRVI